MTLLLSRLFVFSITVNLVGLFWFSFLSEDLFQVAENRVETLEAEEKSLNELIAKREKERENEPVSNGCMSMELLQ